MSVSTIEWTDKTWNPVVGCTRVSPGCDNCYAVTMTRRLEAMGQEKYAGLVNAGKGHFNGTARLVPGDLALPLRWRKPARVFVNSMSDLFHEALSNEEIAAVFGVMAASPHLTFQVLTKRPERAADWFGWAGAYPVGTPDCLCQREAYKIVRDKLPLHTVKGTLKHYPWPLQNVWLGVSAEDQATADERIPLLLQCPASVRFVSYEPALGPVDFGPWLPHCWECSQLCGVRLGEGDTVEERCESCGEDFGEGCCTACDSASWEAACPDCGEYMVSDHPDTVCLDWIIVGGESGPGARPFDVEWARETVRQCRGAGVPVFVKQVGARPLLTYRKRRGESDRQALERTGSGVHGWPPVNRKGGDPAEWPEDIRIRQLPEVRS